MAGYSGTPLPLQLSGPSPTPSLSGTRSNTGSTFSVQSVTTSGRRAGSTYRGLPSTASALSS
jgi:hypothetical protein